MRKLPFFRLAINRHTHATVEMLHMDMLRSNPLATLAVARAGMQGRP